MEDLFLDIRVYSGGRDAALPALCNEASAGFGLTLTEAAVENLQRGRAEALRNRGRVEFGDGVLLKLVTAFCSSPYIVPQDYEQTLAELQEQFYYFKNECRDLLSDDELIEAMRLIFNDAARGSTDYLSGVEWETMCYIARTGRLRGSGLVAENQEGDEYE